MIVPSFGRPTYHIRRERIRVGPCTLSTVQKISVCRLLRYCDTMASQDYKDDAVTDAPQSVEHHKKPAAGLAASMSPERRQQVEKKLKRKLDARCSLFVLIYIMNCKASIYPGPHDIWLTSTLRPRSK